MNIALVGYGIEGEASYRYFSRDTNNSITVFDESNVRPASLPESVTFIGGADAIEQLSAQTFDKVVRTPSLSPHKLVGVRNLTSGTREFFSSCPAPIIGVTGTKGKGTIASLITEILKAAGKKVWLVGNIGTAALDVLDDILKDDIVVYELSSFQLWDLTQSPQTAVISVVEPEHLDVHRDLDDYVEAKANIRRFQAIDDVCFYHPTSELSHRIATTSNMGESHDHAAWLLRAKRYALPLDNAVYVKENTFFIQENVICDIAALQLIGQHNVDNACAAISAALQYTDNFSAVEVGLKNFHGLPHRLQFVRKVNEVSYYDDSIATTPGSAIAALRAFDAPKILIVGGSDKGADFAELAQEVLRHEVRRIITMGKMGPKIAEELDDVGFADVTRINGAMEEAVTTAFQFAKPGDVVILSPSCASFDQYKSYADRGEQFVRFVSELATP